MGGGAVSAAGWGAVDSLVVWRRRRLVDASPGLGSDADRHCARATFGPGCGKQLPDNERRLVDGVRIIGNFHAGRVTKAASAISDVEKVAGHHLSGLIRTGAMPINLRERFSRFRLKVESNANRDADYLRGSLSWASKRPGCQLPSCTPAYEPGVEHRLRAWNSIDLVVVRRPVGNVVTAAARGTRGRGHLSQPWAADGSVKLRGRRAGVSASPSPDGNGRGTSARGNTRRGHRGPAMPTGRPGAELCGK